MTTLMALFLCLCGVLQMHVVTCSLHCPYACDYATIMEKSLAAVDAHIQPEKYDTPNMRTFFETILSISANAFSSDTNNWEANGMKNVSAQCWTDIMNLTKAVQEKQYWALKYLDAVGRPESGILNGAFTWLGDFDLCMSDLYYGNKTVTPIQGHYCIASAPLQPPGSIALMQLTEGLCLPKSCSGEDLKELANFGIEFLSNYLQIPVLKNLKVVQSQCLVAWGELPLTSGAIACICVVSVLLALVLTGTLVHLWRDWLKVSLKKKPNLLPHKILPPGSRKPWWNCCRTMNVFHRLHDEEEEVPSSFSQEDEDGVSSSRRNVNTSDEDAISPSAAMNGRQRNMFDPFNDAVNPPSLIHAGRVSPSMFLPPDHRNGSGTLSQDMHSINGSGRDPTLSGVHGPSVCQRVQEVFLAFSLIQNVSKLMAGCFVSRESASSKPKSGRESAGNDNTLTCLHGIRFISITWIILGHTFSFGYINNTIHWYDTLVHRWTFHAILNSTVSVDTFFLLSGLLTAYLFQLKIATLGSPLRVNWLLFYVHRYWRLTPPYMLVLFVNSNVFRYLWNGPIWPQVTGVDTTCHTNWWTNMLYVNNLVNTNETCMGWTWYLANDMQFYVISPIFLITLFYSTIGGTILVALVAVGSVVANGVISYENNLAAGTMSLLGDGFNLVYIKPWCRIAPYLVGIFVGHILASTRCKLRLNWWIQMALWLAAKVVCFSVIYGLYDPDRGLKDMSVDISAVYNSLFRLSWAMAIGWVIIACACGMGGLVNKLLSWTAFVPLSRLSYSAYLIHPCVLFFIYLSQLTIPKVTIMSMVVFYIAGLCLSYASAFVLSMMAEAPAMALEKILLGKM